MYFSALFYYADAIVMRLSWRWDRGSWRAAFPKLWGVSPCAMDLRMAHRSHSLEWHQKQLLVWGCNFLFDWKLLLWAILRFEEVETAGHMHPEFWHYQEPHVTKRMRWATVLKRLGTTIVNYYKVFWVTNEFNTFWAVICSYFRYSYSRYCLCLTLPAAVLLYNCGIFPLSLEFHMNLW